MRHVQISNFDNGQTLAVKCNVADKFFSRLKGLLGKTFMPVGEGLLIKPCNMVHSLGMKIVIDVLFLSSDDEILFIFEGMTPGKVSPMIKSASYVVELPNGLVKMTGTEVGNRIRLD